MNITKNLYVNINKYMLGTAIALYLTGLFAIKIVHPGLFFVFGAAFFCLFQQKYLMCRLKLAAHVWLIPVVITLITSTLSIEPALGSEIVSDRILLWSYLLTIAIGLLPCAIFFLGKSEEKPGKKERLRIVSVRMWCR